MKFAALFAIILLSSHSWAYTFDQFVGNYQVSDQVTVKNNNAGECVLYNLANLQTIEVKADSGGNHTTHLVTFNSQLGAQSSLQSVHPIMQFRDQAQGGAINYGDTSGGFNFVENGLASIYQQSSKTKVREGVIVGFAISGDSYRFYVKEYRYENNQTVSTCQYFSRLEKVK